MHHRGMQAQRSMMRSRVAKRFGRILGQHGDMAPPAFYPIPVNPNVWGTPWGKVKGAEGQMMVLCFVIAPLWMWHFWWGFMTFHMRISVVGRRPVWVQRLFLFTDQDDPDYWLKYEELEKEVERGDHVVSWGGTNFLASYLWEPGMPEPDKRRRMPDPLH